MDFYEEKEVSFWREEAMDPDDPIYINSIRENDVLRCYRIMNKEKD